MNPSWIDDIVAYRVPQVARPSGYDGYTMRKTATDRGMWAIVDMQWTKQLAEWINGRRVLEIMAGAGWLARALADHGVDIVATDNASWNASHCKMQHLYPVEELGAIAAAKKYADRDVLLCSWPPYEDHTIEHVCNMWSGPIVYIGENNWGCNAGKDFFAHFVIEDTWSIPQWSGLHDYLMIGNYR